MARESLLARSARLEGRGAELAATVDPVPHSEIHARAAAAANEVFALVSKADTKDVPIQIAVMAAALPAMVPMLLDKLNTIPESVLRQIAALLLARVQFILDAPPTGSEISDGPATSSAAVGPGADLAEA